MSSVRGVHSRRVKPTGKTSIEQTTPFDTQRVSTKKLIPRTTRKKSENKQIKNKEADKITRNFNVYLEEKAYGISSKNNDNQSQSSKTTKKVIKKNAADTCSDSKPNPITTRSSSSKPLIRRKVPLKQTAKKDIPPSFAPQIDSPRNINVLDHEKYISSENTNYNIKMKVNKNGASLEKSISSLKQDLPIVSDSSSESSLVTSGIDIKSKKNTKQTTPSKFNFNFDLSDSDDDDLHAIQKPVIRQSPNNVVVNATKQMKINKELLSQLDSSSDDFRPSTSSPKKISPSKKETKKISPNKEPQYVLKRSPKPISEILNDLSLPPEHKPIKLSISYVVSHQAAETLLSEQRELDELRILVDEIRRTREQRTIQETQKKIEVEIPKKEDVITEAVKSQPPRSSTWSALVADSNSDSDYSSKEENNENKIIKKRPNLDLLSTSSDDESEVDNQKKRVEKKTPLQIYEEEEEEEESLVRPTLVPQTPPRKDGSLLERIHDHLVRSPFSPTKSPPPPTKSDDDVIEEKAPKITIVPISSTDSDFEAARVEAKRIGMGLNISSDSDSKNEPQKIPKLPIKPKAPEEDPDYAIRSKEWDRRFDHPSSDTEEIPKLSPAHLIMGSETDSSDEFESMIKPRQIPSPMISDDSLNSDFIKTRPIWNGGNENQANKENSFDSNSDDDYIKSANMYVPAPNSKIRSDNEINDTSPRGDNKFVFDFDSDDDLDYPYKRIPLPEADSGPENPNNINMDKSSKEKQKSNNIFDTDSDEDNYYVPLSKPALDSDNDEFADITSTPKPMLVPKESSGVESDSDSFDFSKITNSSSKKGAGYLEDPLEPKKGSPPQPISISDDSDSYPKIGTIFLQ